MAWTSILLNLIGLKKEAALDERYVLHRYKSTRLAVLTGAILMYAIFMYDLVAHKTIRWDLVVVLGTMAVAKIVGMLYYRKTN